VQQNVVSQTADFRLDALPLDTIPREKRDRSRTAWRGNTAIDMGWALTAVPFADIAVPASVVQQVDVFPRERSELLSRVLNLVLASAALLLTLPVIALIALAIKLTSPGPVLYSQTRVGLDRRHRRVSSSDRRGHDYGGKLFRMYKLRTMRVDAEPDGRAVWAEPGDPRVTSVGRFLRRARLDELPQLYNVIRGDMNIVGPRPERPGIFSRLRDDIPNYSLRQRVKPGITGWAQINQSYDACLDDVRCKVRHDLEYLRRQGVAEDLRIMAMTVPVLLLRRGGW
jgi:lipopolysaccharide/colanic/teichoic acid biosynthesis glycosyltransferase